MGGEPASSFVGSRRRGGGAAGLGLPTGVGPVYSGAEVGVQFGH